MEDFEKLGMFYLGRDAQGGLLLYDSKDLVTHGACIGMTGSGKTGLCLAMLEEALIDRVPVIAIDPKGDLGNLLLTFPSLQGADFQPWVDDAEARRAGLSVEEFAVQQAARWEQGLRDWGQDGARVQRLRESADFVIYTPGSSAGVPVSIMNALDAPPAGDPEAMRERVLGTASSLLGLMGIEADPIQSREHILISTLLNAAWTAGHRVDLGTLIQQIQSPPVARVGVMELDAFYPPKERFELAMRLNSLLAAPGFETWLHGEPLDIDRILYTAEGRPRAAIFSIAHLGDAERMFFVSLLLGQILSWTRRQPGTASLRALVFMDEIAGYFPPVANPPSKAPLLTLLKQARAYGVGLLLATQNPVDIDYKGLSNIGTWFIGKLQTDRDRNRLLEGLEGRVDAGALSDLGNRHFLMNNVHDDAAVRFQTRWTLSYLRGPMGRDQIRTLMEMRRPVERASPAAAAAAPRSETAAPVLPPDVKAWYLPLRRRPDQGLMYEPMLLGAAQVRFVDAKKAVDVVREVAVLCPFAEGALAVDWEASAPAPVGPDELEAAPVADASFDGLPPAAAKAKSYATWSKDFVQWLYGSQSLELFSSARYKVSSAPGETERDFRIRLQQAAREARDAAAEKLRARFAPKIATLQERLRRAEQAVQREKDQASQSGFSTAITVGASLLGSFFGRRASVVSGAASAARGVGRTMGQAGDVRRAEETVDSVRSQLDALEADFKAELDALDANMDAMNEPLETTVVKPKKTNIAVSLVCLAWAPLKVQDGVRTPAWS